MFSKNRRSNLVEALWLSLFLLLFSSCAASPTVPLAAALELRFQNGASLRFEASHPSGETKLDSRYCLNGRIDPSATYVSVEITEKMWSRVRSLLEKSNLDAVAPKDFSPDMDFEWEIWVRYSDREFVALGKLGAVRDKAVIQLVEQILEVLVPGGLRALREPEGVPHAIGGSLRQAPE